MAATPRSTYRLPAQTKAILRAIGEARDIDETRIIIRAVEEYGKRILGRRMADLAPVRARPDRGRRGMPG